MRTFVTAWNRVLVKKRKKEEHLWLPPLNDEKKKKKLSARLYKNVARGAELQHLSPDRPVSVSVERVYPMSFYPVERVIAKTVSRPSLYLKTVPLTLYVSYTLALYSIYKYHVRKCHNQCFGPCSVEPFPNYLYSLFRIWCGYTLLPNVYINITSFSPKTSTV